MDTTIQNQRSFEAIRYFICNKLGNLDSHLTYHNLSHTLDVVQQSERIAKEEGLTDERKLFLLKVAALYHDTGFLNTYANHEIAGCRIFLAEAEQFDFSVEEQSFITRLIMATRLPQTPNDIYEMVICDADLDYLGRPDFFSIGNELRKEFLHFGVVSSNEQWEELQIRFLSAHHYHTETSQRQREGAKQKYLASLR